MTVEADPRLIVPLDFPTVEEARKAVDGLADAETHERAFERMKRYTVGSTTQGLVPTLAAKFGKAE